MTIGVDIKNKEFLVQNILTNPNKNLSKNELEKLSLYKNENNKIPVIFIGAGTCGLGAGAEKTIAATKNYLLKNGIEASIVETGCIGLCSSEPIVDIKLPGKNRISFENITVDKVESLLESIFSDKLNGESKLGQFYTEENKEWQNVNDINDHPFFKPQTSNIFPIMPSDGHTKKL